MKTATIHSGKLCNVKFAKYDYLIVGAGLFGATFANEVTRHGKSCLVIDRRSHIAGNAYTEMIEDIQVHKYGAHIFHTSNKMVWEYVNRFTEFNHYINSPVARFGNQLFNLPFNMNTFYQLWGVTTPSDALAKIEEQREYFCNKEPFNLEEQALSLVGRDIYEKLIKGYTEKQWGRSCKDLPTSILTRLPLRFTFDNNYFDDCYQGIPINGYTQMIENMLAGIEVLLNTNYHEFIFQNPKIATTTIYTGAIDEFFNYCYGKLEYRSLHFDTSILPIANFQGNAVVNYTSLEIPFTRIIEHKHFDFGKQSKTVLTYEYPVLWQKGLEPYYPINDKKNTALYEQYKNLATKHSDILFCGRLGQYAYFDMDKTIAVALELAQGDLTSI